MVSFACHKENPPLSMHPEIHDDPLDLEWPDHTKSESRPLTKEEWAMASRYVHPRAHLGKTLWAWWNIITLPCMAFLYEKGLAFGDQGWRFSPNENPFDNFWAIVMGVSWACWLFGWWMQDYGLEFHKVSGRLRLLARYRLAVGNVEADHDYDDTKLMEGKFYHAVFQRSKRGGEWRVRFIGSLGWGPEEHAGANWPSRLTLLSWALVPVFLCLHTRMASFAVPAQDVVGGTWQFLWYAIPNELRFQEGLTLALYQALGLLLLAGGVSLIRWKWRQIQNDRLIQDAPFEYPLDKIWESDKRDDCRLLRRTEIRLVMKLGGSQRFVSCRIMSWPLKFWMPVLFILAASFIGQQKTPGFLEGLTIFALCVVLIVGPIFRVVPVDLKISGRFKACSDQEFFLGSRLVKHRGVSEGLEEGVLYHAVASRWGEDADEYWIEFIANHGWEPEDTMSIPLWTLWSIVMLPALWLLYSRSEDFKVSAVREEIPFVGMVPQGLRVGSYEFPLVTNLAGALTLATYFLLLALVSWGFLQGLRWAFRKWKARDSAEVDDLM